MVRTTEKMMKASGICGTCRNVSGCVHYASRGLVHFCEMFENEMIDTGIRTRSDEFSPASQPLPDDAPENTSPRNGLCLNCENRHSCAVANTPEGIWHCEEYE